MGQSEALQEILRRNSRPGRKQTMKIIRTQSDMFGELRQIRLIGVIFIQIPDDTCNPFVIAHEAIYEEKTGTTTRFLLRNLSLSQQGICHFGQGTRYPLIN